MTIFLLSKHAVWFTLDKLILAPLPTARQCTVHLSGYRDYRGYRGYVLSHASVIKCDCLAYIKHC